MLLEKVLSRRLFKQSPYITFDEFTFRAGTMGVRKKEMRGLVKEMKEKNVITEKKINTKSYLFPKTIRVVEWKNGKKSG